VVVVLLLVLQQHLYSYQPYKATQAVTGSCSS
jgi:hypothetical protein